jgi:hypothetical protein
MLAGVVWLECLGCRTDKAFPIGATGLAICPRCAERIYQPFAELYATLRAYGLVGQEERRRRQPKKVEEVVEAEAEEQPQQAEAA